MNPSAVEHWQLDERWEGGRRGGVVEKQKGGQAGGVVLIARVV